VSIDRVRSVILSDHFGPGPEPLPLCPGGTVNLDADLPEKEADAVKGGPELVRVERKYLRLRQQALVSLNDLLKQFQGIGGGTDEVPLDFDGLANRFNGSGPYRGDLPQLRPSVPKFTSGQRNGLGQFGFSRNMLEAKLFAVAIGKQRLNGVTVQRPRSPTIPE
jgi:hypothetical protein